MPELPEVEVTRRGLAPYVVGKDVQAVAVRDARLRWPVPRNLADCLTGRRVEQLDRRGKYLLWRFAQGTLISHLGMSGVWRVWPRSGAPPPQRHDHIDIVFTRHLLRLTDPRRFGALLWHRADAGPVEAHPLLAGLGLEPFDARFAGALLHRETRPRSAAIKQVLLAGDIVVGVGNIYASEGLDRKHPPPPSPKLKHLHSGRRPYKGRRSLRAWASRAALRRGGHVSLREVLEVDNGKPARRAHRLA